MTLSKVTRRPAIIAISDICFVLLLTLVAWRLFNVDAVGGEADAFLKDRRGTLYSTAVSVHASMLGFVLATAAIVLGYAQSDRFAVLRQSRHYLALYRVFTTGVGAFALATLASLAALFFDRETAQNYFTASAAIATSVVAVARLGRLLVVLVQVIEIIVTDRSRSPGDP